MYTPSNKVHIASILAAVRLATKVKQPLALRVATVAVPVLNCAASKINNPRLIIGTACIGAAVNLYRTAHVVKTKQFKRECKVGLQNLAFVAPILAVDYKAFLKV